MHEPNRPLGRPSFSTQPAKEMQLSRDHSSARRPLAFIAFGVVIAGCASFLAWSQGAYNIQEPPARQAPPAQAAPPVQQAPAAPVQFTRTCSLCHGGDGLGTDRAPTLVNSPRLRMMSDRDISDIIQKGKGKMPAFPLAPADLAVMMRYMRSLNPNAAAETTVPGDAKAGESIFFGDGQCASCHVARGRGSSIGPDLSSVANRLRAAYLKQAFVNPGANITTGYGSVTVVLNDGSKLQGFARAEGSHDLVLQTKDSKLRLLLD